MQRIHPCATLDAALNALDNGGRFYHLFSDARDEVIDAGELARAAGVIGDRQKVWLYFDMALADLSSDHTEQVVRRLSPALREQRARHRPRSIDPADLAGGGVDAGDAVVVTGIPHYTNDESHFRGFITMVTPVTALIPIIEVYQTYLLETGGDAGSRGCSGSG